MDLKQLTDEELELLLYETQETHDTNLQKKILDERKRRSLEE